MKIMSKKILIGIIVVVAVIILGISLYWFVQRQPEKYTGPVKKVTMGISSPNLFSSLIYITREKGYFLEEGIDMEIKDYPGWKICLISHIKRRT